MIYDDVLERGVAKQNIPSPRIVEFQKSSNLSDVITKAKLIFFPDKDIVPEGFALANSHGVPFSVEDRDDWVLSEFLSIHGSPQQASSVPIVLSLCKCEINSL